MTNKFQFIINGGIIPTIEPDFILRRDQVLSVSHKRNIQQIRTFGGQVLDFVANSEIESNFVLRMEPRASWELLNALKKNVNIVFENKKFWVTSYQFESDDNEIAFKWNIECRMT